MKDLIKAALAWLRKLPIGRWIGLAAKPVAAEIVTKEGAKLKAGIDKSIAEGKPIDPLFDSFQAGLKSAIWLLPFLPPQKKELACRFVQDEGDRLQAQAREVVKAGGPAAAHALIDASVTVLIQRIQSL